MNATVSCPNCQQHLQVQSPPPAGTPLQCYHCGANFRFGLEPLPTWPPGNRQPYALPSPPGRPSDPAFQQHAPYSHASKPLANYPPTDTLTEGNGKLLALLAVVVVGGGLFLLLIVAGITYALLSSKAIPVAKATPLPPIAAPNALSPHPTIVPNTTFPVPAPSIVSPNVPPGSTVPPTVPVPPATTIVPAGIGDGNALAFGFAPGMSYGYSFQLQVETGDEGRPGRFPPRFNLGRSDNHFTGFVGYTAQRPDPEKLKQILNGKTGEGSGTAFVVHPDGLLITCEHVIRSAAKIEVTVNERTYEARVLAVDRKRDLAILKIAATGLTPLPLGNSEQVRLAEEVRAVGYPLSDVLGTGVKITRGTIAGFVEKGGKLFQVDASINPGNSGGPLVNAKGEVLGVCSSGLFGNSVAPVGFAIPSNDVQQFLQTQKQVAQATPAGAALDGPDLAQRVAPAVAFVKVAIGVDGTNACLLDFMGHYTNGASLGGMHNGQGQIVATRQGEILSSEGEGTLPFLTGTYANMALDRLPEAGETTWESRNECLLTLSTQVDNSPFGPSPSARFRGRMRSPFDPEPQHTTTVPAIERTTWKLGARTGDLQILEKHMEFSTLEPDAATRLVDLSGDGTVSFDVKRGLVKETHMKFIYRGTRGNVTTRLPMTFKCQLYSERTPEQTAAAIEEARQKAAALNAAPTSVGKLTSPPQEAADEATNTAVPEPPVVDEATKVRTLLAAVRMNKPSDLSGLYTALCNISFIKPIPELRDEVSQTVDPLLTSKELLARSGSMNVVKKWFTPHNVPSLLKLLDSLDDAGRTSAIGCLGEHSRDPKVAERLASLLQEPGSRYAAKLALGKMGPVAEEAVLPLLVSEEEEVRQAICDVLSNAGTAKCLPELEKLAVNKASGSVRSQAQSALREVKMRLDKAAN